LPFLDEFIRPPVRWHQRFRAGVVVRGPATGTARQTCQGVEGGGTPTTFEQYPHADPRGCPARPHVLPDRSRMVTWIARTQFKIEQATASRSVTLERPPS